MESFPSFVIPGAVQRLGVAPQNRDRIVNNASTRYRTIPDLRSGMSCRSVSGMTRKVSGPKPIPL